MWIFPILTIFIGIWILFYHYIHQGSIITLITSNAEGIEEGRTTIRSRNVHVGIVKSIMLTDDFNHVKITARINAKMKKLLHDDSMFWMVKPQINNEGISGLDTLLSGAYIELRPGKKNNRLSEYQLLDSPPFISPDSKGIHIILKSEKVGQLNPGDPVLFHGCQVGSVEKSIFDSKKHIVRYQIFIKSPNDYLITNNIHFWKENGIAINLTETGMHVEMCSLTTFFRRGVSFDVPEGDKFGQLVSEKTEFPLYENQNNIQDSIFKRHIDCLMFFKDSVHGLQSGAPVEFRGIRLGTVVQVPFFIPELHQSFNNDYRIPVLIRIEPERLENKIGNNLYFNKKMSEFINYELRGSLKIKNLLTGSLYIEMDFHPKEKKENTISKFKNYKIIQTESGEITKLQQQMIDTLGKFNSFPVNLITHQTIQTLNQSQFIMQHLKIVLDNFNKLIVNRSTQKLPQDIEKMLHQINFSMQSFQPGSDFYTKMSANMQNLDKVLRDLQPLLKILNEKSNALIFSFKNKKDPYPKRMKE